MIVSKFSNFNALDLWLKTPMGSLAYDKKWGNPITELNFKNIQIATLNKLIDKIEIDLGKEVAQNISNIELVKDNFETLAIKIDYNNNVIIYKDNTDE